MADLIKTIYDGDEVPNDDVESDIEEEVNLMKYWTSQTHGPNSHSQGYRMTIIIHTVFHLL